MTSFVSSSAKRAFVILGLLALCFHSAYAHTYLSSVVLNNGDPLAEGDCVRPHPLGGYDSPIPLLNASDMTCGWLPTAANAANRKCPITAGQTISLQWHHQSAAPGDDIIDPSHNGPIIVYLAKSDTGAGNVWFKIYEDGFANGQWAVQRLLANGGRVDIPLPSDIAPGNYLLRGELLALHGAYALNGVQPYVGCVELTISGSGTKNPAGVAFPGYYTQTDPGMLFSIYQPFTTYIIPGPPKYVSGSSSSSSSSSGSSSGSNTVAPTATPTTTPTSKPPTSPTTRPTDPTSAPATSAPTSAPTSPPSSGSSSNIKVGLNSGTSAWWVGVVVSGGGETTVKVELADSGSFSNWVTLTDKSYAFVFEAPSILKAPLSLRLTSSTGKQVVLSNIFPSLTSNNNLLDSGKSYSGSSGTSAPTTAPTAKPTSAPTAKPTSAPTSQPTTGNAKVNIYPDSSQWWFAVTISGTTESISKIELKDAGSRTSYQALTNAGWAYTFNTQGVALVTPLTVKVTTASGKVTYATVSTITPGASLETASQ